MRSGWLRLLQTHNRGLIFHCTAVCQSRKHTHTHTGSISCRHHKPTASLIEFSFPITSSDDLITFPFDATHKNKRTLDGISPFSVCVSLSVSLPSSLIADNLVVALQMTGHDSEVHFPELSYSLWSTQFSVQSTDGVQAALFSNA